MQPILASVFPHLAVLLPHFTQLLPHQPQLQVRMLAMPASLHWPLQLLLCPVTALPTRLQTACKLRSRTFCYQDSPGFLLPFNTLGVWVVLQSARRSHGTLNL